MELEKSQRSQAYACAYERSGWLRSSPARVSHKCDPVGQRISPVSDEPACHGGSVERRSEPSRVRYRMQKFQIFYFRENRLHHSEELQVRDMLDAVDLVRGSEADMRAEIWSDRGKGGVIGPAPGIN